MEYGTVLGGGDKWGSLTMLPLEACLDVAFDGAGDVGQRSGCPPATVSPRRRPGSILRTSHIHGTFSHLTMDSGFRRNDTECAEVRSMPILATPGATPSSDPTGTIWSHPPGRHVPLDGPESGQQGQIAPVGAIATMLEQAKEVPAFRGNDTVGVGRAVLRAQLSATARCGSWGLRG